jgi:hypothetical protein
LAGGRDCVTDYWLTLTITGRPHKGRTMLHTRTAIEYRNGVAAVVPTIVGVDRIVDEAVDRKARLDAERAVDEVLADSFPASDPPSWNSGIIRPQPAVNLASGSVAAEAAGRSLRMVDVIGVSGPTHGVQSFLRALRTLFGAAGFALLFGVAILLVGLPIVLIVRGVLEAIGWLFGIPIG